MNFHILFVWESTKIFQNVACGSFNQVMLSFNFQFQVDRSAYIDNAEWQYDSGYSTSAQIPVCCPIQNYTVPYFYVKFTRLRPFYVINLIIPALLLSVCMVLTFLLPTECGERLGYSLTILLSYTVLMTITSSLMPTTSQQTPYIGKLVWSLTDLSTGQLDRTFSVDYLQHFAWQTLSIRLASTCAHSFARN